MKKLNWLSGLCLVVLVGCGGGGGSGTSSTDTSTSTSGTPSALTVFVASTAPTSGSSCILRDSAGNTIDGPVMSLSGRVDFTVPGSIPNSWMSIKCTGGSYTDPATQTVKTLSSTTILRNTFYFESGTTTAMVVTPLTEIAYQEIIGYVYQNYPPQLEQISTILGLGTADVSEVTPTDVNTTKADASIAGQYGTLLAAFSQMMKDKPASYPDLNTLITALFNGIKQGALSATLKTDLLAAMNNLTTNLSIKDNILASMAGLGGTQYTKLNAGNASGALTITVYGGGTAIIGQAYSSLIATATGGTPTYSFTLDTLIVGAPPIGMSVDINGYLKGTPTIAGSYTFGVCVKDLVATSTCKSTVIVVKAATTTTTSSSSSGSGSSDNYYYHWNCNGDDDCLSTNPDGTATGTSNLGPGAAGSSGCNSLLNFASHFWGDAATSVCDHNP